MRILVVGTGVRGSVWARICADNPQVSLAGLVDRDPSRARTLQQQLPNPHLSVYPDIAEALEEASPDAVIIATPPDTHHGLVDAALASGAHVLCEKPLSDDMGGVIAMIRKARAGNLLLFVGMNFRYLSVSQRIRQYVRAGRLGDLSHAQFSYLRHRDGNRADLNDYPLKMPFPMLFEQSIHHFDLLRYCYGSEVESLVADSWKPAWSTYAEDCCVSVLFRFANGVRVNYLGTWTAAWNRMIFNWRSEFSGGVLIQRSQFDDLVRVEFEPGLALDGARFKGAEESEPPQREELEPCVPFVDDSRLLLEELVGAIQGGVKTAPTAEDHLRSLCLVLASIESIQTGKWVKLRDFHLAIDIPPGLLRGESDAS